MASTLGTVRAWKNPVSRDSDASGADFSDVSSSSESNNDATSSDFSSDDEVPQNQPGTSTAAC